MVPNESRTLSMELEEMIPVEQFFDEYVTRLQRSAFSEEVNPYDVGGMPPLSNSVAADVVSGSDHKMSLGGDRGYRETTRPVENYGAFMEPPIGQPFGNQIRSDGALVQRDEGVINPVYIDGGGPSQGYGTQPPYSTVGGGVQHGYAGGMAFRGGNGGGSTSQGLPFSAGEPFDAYPQSYGPHDESTETTVGFGPKKAKLKSARQQQLNKLAQQRYRERKKAKTLGLEKTIDQLKHQLEELNNVKKEKSALERKNSELKTKLAEKEAELQSTRAQLQEAKTMDSDPKAEWQETVKGERSAKQVGLNSKPAIRFHKKVKDLRKYLADNNLDQSLLVNPLSDNIPKKVVDDIYALVGDVCTSCMELNRIDGPDLWELVSASLDNKQKETLDRIMWRSIAESLQLTKEQVTSALTLRQEHLEKLDKIFIERQTLNLEAIKYLLPADQGGRAPVSTPYGCFNIATFVQRMQHRAKVSKVLDKLKANLSKEQKANSELEYLAFYKVMSPLQGAWFTVSAYPHQCDCLEFLNAVYDLDHSVEDETDAMISES